MEPRAVYKAIQASAPEGIDERVLDVMKQRRGMENRISRRELVFFVYGVDLPAGTNLANNRQDRNIREAIERLRTEHPILSSSGNGGVLVCRILHGSGRLDPGAGEPGAGNGKAGAG